MSGGGFGRLPLTLFRIAKSPAAVTSDFVSRMAECEIPRPEEVADPGMWAGLSMWDSHERAANMSRRWRHRGLGTYVARITIPDDAPTSVPAIARPTRGPGHYTVWSCAGRLTELVVDTVSADA